MKAFYILTVEAHACLEPCCHQILLTGVYIPLTKWKSSVGCFLWVKFNTKEYVANIERDFELHKKYSHVLTTEIVRQSAGWHRVAAQISNTGFCQDNKPYVSSLRKSVFLFVLFCSCLIVTMWSFSLKVVHLKLDCSQGQGLVLWLGPALNEIISGWRYKLLGNAFSGVGKVRCPWRNPDVVEITWVVCYWL